MSAASRWFVAGAGVGALMTLDWIPLTAGGVVAVFVVVALSICGVLRLEMTAAQLARMGGLSYQDDRPSEVGEQEGSAP